VTHENTNGGVKYAAVLPCAMFTAQGISEIEPEDVKQPLMGLEFTTIGRNFEWVGSRSRRRARLDSRAGKNTKVWLAIQREGTAVE
jgi:hypothetical protein